MNVETKRYKNQDWREMLELFSSEQGTKAGQIILSF